MQNDLMHFHHYVSCHMYYDNMKLGIRYVPVVDDLRTSTGTCSLKGINNLYVVNSLKTFFQMLDVLSLADNIFNNIKKKIRNI